MGKRRSKLELGAGAAYSYEHLSAGGVKEDSSFLNFYCNVGWRWQARSGFLFRIGLSPVFATDKDNYWSNSITFGDEYDSRLALSLYIGIGWSF